MISFTIYCCYIFLYKKHNPPQTKTSAIFDKVFSRVKFPKIVLFNYWKESEKYLEIEVMQHK